MCAGLATVSSVLRLLPLTLLSAAALAEPQVRLPPSDAWKELEATAQGARVFALGKDATVTLTVAVSDEPPQRYTPEFMMELSRKVAKQAKGQDLHVTEATSIMVMGANVGVMRTSDVNGKAVRYWVPGDDADLLLTLRKKEGWNRDAENEVSNAVSLATGIRGKPPTSDSELALYGGIGAVVLIVVGLVVAVLRRPKTRAAPTRR